MIQERERELQENTAKLEEAQRVAHVGYWEWDLRTDLVTWSDETYRIYGLHPQECINKFCSASLQQVLVFAQQHKFLALIEDCN